MIYASLKAAWRRLTRHKLYACIAVGGLAVAMATATLLLLFVRQEMTVDHGNQKLDRIYRVESNGSAVMPPAVGRDLASQFPQIESVARLSYGENLDYRVGEKRGSTGGFFWADPALFSIFSFRFLQGEPLTALTRPHSLVLTESLAERIFGDESPMGRVIRCNDMVDFTVTGVIADPRQMHIPIQALGSFSTLLEIYPGLKAEQYEDEWAYPTYVALARGQRPGDLERAIDRYYVSHGIHGLSAVHLRPLAGLYFYSGPLLGDTYRRHGNHDLQVVLVAIAVFVLFLAATNYVNLATALATEREKEVGVRKALGAHRGQLVAQFLGESLLASLLAMLGAGAMVELLLSPFNNVLHGHLSLGLAGLPFLTVSALGLAAVVGSISGIYPALVLSGPAPAAALRGESSRGRKGAILRRGFIVVQFAISITLLIVTLVVLSQTRFMRGRGTGFTSDRVVVLQLNREIKRHREAFRQELLGYPGISKVAYSCRVPGENLWTWGAVTIGGKKLPYVFVDAVEPDYLDLMDLKIASGRGFSRRSEEGGTDEYLINETLARMLGLDDPVGSAVVDTGNGDDGRVVGVVRDFHVASLRHAISPLLLYQHPGSYGRVSIAIDPGHEADALRHIRSVWEVMAPEFLFRYDFLDRIFNRQYQEEARLTHVLTYFTALAMLIACVGLFGLASFLTLTRTKEVAIRKIAGATASGIALLFVGDFLRWVLLANLIAWPAAFLLGRRWLEGYAYHGGLSALPFVSATLLSLILAAATVSIQAIRAATGNPVESLRWE